MLSDEELITLTKGQQTAESIYRLFEALEDLNWPNSEEAAEHLRQMPTLAAPVALKVFEERKLYTYFMLSSVFPYWPKEAVAVIKDYLQKYTEDDNYGEYTDLMAMEILVTNDLMSHTQATQELERKKAFVLQKINEYPERDRRHFHTLEDERIRLITTNSPNLNSFIKEHWDELDKVREYLTYVHYYNEIKDIKKSLGL